jgi:hypothetical protein
MLSGGSIAMPKDYIAWVMMGLLALHAFISVDLIISAHAEGGKRKCKKYAKMNASTIVQRVTGFVMVPITALHVAGAAKLMQPPEIVHAILPPVFFTVVMVHVAVSVSKALITLGIGSARLVKAVDIAVKVVCGITLIADVIGFYLHTITGVL